MQLCTRLAALPFGGGLPSVARTTDPRLRGCRSVEAIVSKLVMVCRLPAPAPAPLFPGNPPLLKQAARVSK